MSKIAEAVRRTRTRRGLLRGRRWRTGLIAVTVVLLLAGVTACTGDGIGRSPGETAGTQGDAVRPDGAGSAGSQSSARSAGACGGAAGGTWQPLPAPPTDGFAGAVIEDVLPGDDGDAKADGAAGSAPWLAVGARVVDKEKVAPAVWRLRNRGWVADRTVPATLFGREERLIGVGRHDRRLMAMGVTYSDYEARARPSAWTERDGAWREVPTLRELFGGPRTVDVKDMAAGELGFVVVGPRDDRRGQQMAGVWRSQDGTDWAWPPQDTPLTGAHGEVVTPLAVAVGGPGIVVVGTTIPQTKVLPQVEDGAVWWSADGRRWERIDTTATFGGPGTQQPTVVTWTGDAFVAAGVSADKVGGRLRPAAWVSRDGRSWQRAPADAFTVENSEDDARLTTLTNADGCVVAGGLVGSSSRLWTSRDGLTWTPLPPPADSIEVHGKVLAAAHRGELLVVLSEPELGRSRAWTRALPPVK